MEELKCHFYNNIAIAIVAIIFVIMIMIIIKLLTLPESRQLVQV